MSTQFEVSLVARTPASSGAPTLTEVDRLVCESIRYTDELNRPGSATLACNVSSLSDAVKARLANLRSFPSEVWIYSDAELVWAGYIATIGIQGQVATLNCIGLLGYTARMGIVSDVTYTAEDQFTIAADLIDDWQALSYGHYGIDTSSVGTSGVTRDRTYLRNDLKDVWGALSDLGAVLDGFDMHVTPDTRELVLSYPERGVDLSASVVLDERSIDSASEARSVAVDDLVSDFGGTSSGQAADGTQSNLYTYRENATLQAAFGRSWKGQSFFNIVEQTTLDGKGDAYLASRGQQMIQPGVTLIPNVGNGTEIGQFGVGDTVAYSYDAGLGLLSGNYRVGKLEVSIAKDGAQRVGVEFI